MKTKNLLLFAGLCSVTLGGCNPSEPLPSSTDQSSKITTSSSEDISSSSEDISSSSEDISSSSEDISSQGEESTSKTNTEADEVKYLITFKDENGEVLESSLWEKNTVPFYDYVKLDNIEWDYTVLGWSLTQNGEVLPSLPAVTEDATYYAVVSKAKQKYTITFESNGGSLVQSITADYGSMINEPNKPEKEGYRFVGWSLDYAGMNKVEWPYKLTEDVNMFAQYNEKLEIKGLLTSMMSVTEQDPYSFLPNTMKSSYAGKHVSQEEVSYDFNDFVNVSDIKYGGYGEQWHMVLENIAESERFYNVLSLGETLINSSVALFNNYFDNNPSNSATHTIKQSEYSAYVNYSEGILTYSISLKTGFTIPFFGEIIPQIDITYDVSSGEKSVRIQISENNVMTYCSSENKYTFALKYGVESVSRKAFFEIERKENNVVEGHIYEFVQYKDKELIPSCADFYIDENFVVAVGNKASGLVGFKGTINELYNVRSGKLLGYEVEETIKVFGIEGTYHTLWFNLNDIRGVDTVKAIESEESTSLVSTNKNPHNIYLNGSEDVFEPVYNTKLGQKTSRKYDVELRKQFFYGYEEDKLVEHQTSIPMMFIQADNDKDTNFSDFPKDMKSKNGIDAQVMLSQDRISKIEKDHKELIPVFKENKEKVNSEFIESHLGNPVIIVD